MEATTPARWFERTKNPSRMVLTTRDRQILAFAHEHRLISTTHVCTLLGAATPGQVDKVRKRLRLLFDHGFLDVPRLQVVDHRRTGSVPKVYALSRRGAAEIEKAWRARNDEIGRTFFRHTLFTTEIMVALERGARELGTVRIVPFEELLADAPQETQQERHPGQWKATVSRREAERITWQESIGITPDKIFGIEFLDAPKGKGRFLVFLEADRATEPVIRTLTRRGIPKPKQLSSIYRKLLAYKAAFNDCLERRYGFENGFRVLTVTTRPGRVKSMVAATETLNGGRRMFLFAAEEEFLAGNPLTFECTNGHGEPRQLVDTAF